MTVLENKDLLCEETDLTHVASGKNQQVKIVVQYKTAF